MFQHYWRMPEGFLVGAGLIGVGLALQMIVGPVQWAAFAFPINFIVLALYLALLALLYGLRHKARGIQFLLTPQAAVPALVYAAGLTIVMGLTRQGAADAPPSDPIGLTRMLAFWPFVLVYVWLTTIVGLIAIRQVLHFRWREVPSLLCHLGLFVAIVAATLGSADLQRLKLTATEGQPEWRAFDAKGNVHELPLAIELQDFSIKEYPPKLMLIDSKSGKGIPADRPQQLLIDKHFEEGTLGHWRIRILKNWDQAAPVMERDTTHYVEWRSQGALSALLVEAQPLHNEQPQGKPLRGWITCGSYLFPFQELALNKHVSLVMAQREPERYTSQVLIYTQAGEKYKTTIEVNNPARVAGWSIYQLSYDERMGRWSETSTFELVADPWLPAVYAGIYILLLGAILLFASAQKRKSEATSL